MKQCIICRKKFKVARDGSPVEFYRVHFRDGPKDEDTFICSQRCMMYSLLPPYLLRYRFLMWLYRKFEKIPKHDVQMVRVS